MSRYLLYVAGESGAGHTAEFDDPQEVVEAVRQLTENMMSDPDMRLLTFSVGDMEATISDEEVHGQS